MPSTYLSLHYHIVFSTKDRFPWITESWKTEVHQYLSGTIEGLNGISEGVGGVADHVHLLVGLKATHCLSDFVRDLKRSTSIWVQEKFQQPAFAWQEGYAAFTVSATSRSSVRRYIENQAEHHRKLSFREELIRTLERAGVEFDSKYLD
jgi:REP element-mobilizing transposase RayT